MTTAVFRGLTGTLLCSVLVGAQGTLPTADAVLSELKTGNAHHVAKRYQHPHQTADRQRELASAQHPHAIVLSCADSRVAPEIVFDQGLGDLFDVRVAGNVAGDAEIASIEYAASHLHVPVLVVVGHQHCGAVSAAAEGGEAEGHLPSLLAMIRPAVEAARKQPGDLIENAVRINVENVVRQLHDSTPVLAELVGNGKLTVVGAVYSLDTGRVEWLSHDRASAAPQVQVRYGPLTPAGCPRGSPSNRAHSWTVAPGLDPLGRLERLTSEAAMTPLNWPYAIDGHVLCINGPLRTPMDPEVRQGVRALLHGGQRRIVLDLTRVSDIDAAGIGELVRAYNTARAANGTIQVVNTTRRVRELIERVGLDALLLADPVTFSLVD